MKPVTARSPVSMGSLNFPFISALTLALPASFKAAKGEMLARSSLELGATESVMS